MYHPQLISTIPLDIMLRWTNKSLWADELTYSSTHVIGLGLRGHSPHGDKCWMYYPEDNCPFYRCTVFSHYAKKNAPAEDVCMPTKRLGDPTLPVPDATSRRGPYWSLLFEVSENKTYKPVNLDTIVEVRLLNIMCRDADVDIDAYTYVFIVVLMC
jgi:hypothetical protein